MASAEPHAASQWRACLHKGLEGFGFRAEGPLPRGSKYPNNVASGFQSHNLNSGA